MLRFMLRVAALCVLFIPFVVLVAPAAAAPCSAPAGGEIDVTREGTVFASTVFEGFTKEQSIDCDTATSWFSTGPESNDQPTIFRWTGARDDKITRIFIQSNRNHPQFPTNFGFGAVTVRVRDGANNIVYEEQNIPLPGTPDPDIVLQPNVVGRVVELLFSGHEADNCGGISELQIFADRTPPTNTPLPPPTATKIPPIVAPPTVVPPTSNPIPPSATTAAAQGPIIVNAVDDDPENQLWNCPTNRVPFGNEEVDRSRCFTFRYPVPVGGITSATVHLAIDTLGSLQDTDATIVAVAAPTEPCAWGLGNMPGCVVLHGGFSGEQKSLNLNLLDIACDPSVQGSPEAQQLVLAQLQTGTLHMELQDDTALYSAQLVLNRGAPSFVCGTSSDPISSFVPTPDAVPTTSVATGAPPGSDSFDRPDTNDPCALGSISSNGRQLFYLPIFPSAPTDPKPLGAHIVSGALQNNGLDYGGFQFALSDACAQPRGVVRGADMGQDLNLRVDLFVPTNAAGLITQAGPYFRSRAAAYADGIIGGESAGYWVQLESTGEIKIKRLNPQAIVATSCKPVSFDASKTHTLEISANGAQLQVALDGKIQVFRENERVVNVVNIPATGGANNGTAGIAFGAEPNRGQIGGQRADNIIISAFQPLSLPLEDNCASANNASETATAIAAVTPTTTNQQPTQVAVVPTKAAPATTGTGDCDNDTKLTELDALCALQMSVQLIAINFVMDVDGNGVVDSRDAVIILQRAIGK